MRAKSIALIEHRVTAVVAETSADDDDTRIERVLIEIIEEDDPAPEGKQPDMANGGVAEHVSGSGTTELTSR